MQCAALIKEIGRGKDGARSLSHEQARDLWAAILAGEVSDLELGAILLAMRVKGETTNELAGFLDATHAAMSHLPDPAAAYAPVVIPSYNGARHLPNLVPLLALMLAERGVPVLVHGVVSDPMGDLRGRGVRVTTADVLHAMGIDFIRHGNDLPGAVRSAATRRLPVFAPIQVLHPRLAYVLGLRRVLGVRNSAHTLAKLLQPFAGSALRLGSFTHPEYEVLLRNYFLSYGGSALISRGSEGEVVANARRSLRIEAFNERVARIVVEGQDVAPANAAVLPVSRDAAVTAVWTQSVLAGEHPVPQPIAEQFAVIMEALQNTGRSAQAVAA